MCGAPKRIADHVRRAFEGWAVFEGRIYGFLLGLLVARFGRMRVQWRRRRRGWGGRGWRVRGAVGGRRLLGGLVAHKDAMRLAFVGVTVDHLVAAVSLTVVSHKRWQPPRRASDAIVFLNTRSGTLCCGRVEQRAASKALCSVVSHAEGLFKCVQ